MKRPRFRAMLSCWRIKITTGVLPVSTSSTMRRSLWLILPSASTTLAGPGLKGAALSDQRAEEGVFTAKSDGVEVADDDAVGLPKRGAGVGDTLGGAVGGDERLRFT